MLEPELARWIARHRLRERLGDDAVDELADHLLCRASALLLGGLSAEAAFDRAAHELGDPARLARALRKEARPMHPASRLVGAALVAGVLLLVLSGTPGIAVLVHAPALLLVLGVVIGGLWANFGPRAVVAALRASLDPSAAPTEADREHADAVLARGAGLSWVAGFLGALLGVIALLTNLADPAQIGPGLALALTTLLFGAMLAELGFRTLRQWLATAAPVRARVRD